MFMGSYSMAVQLPFLTFAVKLGKFFWEKNAIFTLTLYILSLSEIAQDYLKKSKSIKTGATVTPGNAWKPKACKCNL